MIPNAKTNDQILNRIQDLLKKNDESLSPDDAPSSSVIISQEEIAVPITISPQYMAIGKLLVAELPQGALARYERDAAVLSIRPQSNSK